MGLSQKSGSWHLSQNKLCVDQITYLAKMRCEHWKLWLLILDQNKRAFIIIISYFVFFKSFQNLPIATIAIDDKKTGTSLHERDNWHNHFRSIPKGHFPLQIKEKWRFHCESDLLIFGIVKAYKMNFSGCMKKYFWFNQKIEPI